MPILNLIKSFFNKEGYEEKGKMGLNDFHPQLKILLAFNGIFFNNKDSYIRFLWPFICICLSIVAGAFQTMHILHAVSVDDFSMAIESFAYSVIILLVPCIYYCMLIKSTDIVLLLNKMENDFKVINNMDPLFRKEFYRGQLYVWKLDFLWLGFLGTAYVMFCLAELVALLYYSLLSTQDENSVRPLMFHLWLPYDDPYRTPNFEIFLFLEYLLSFLVAASFATYMCILLHCNIHSYVQIDMINMVIRMLFQDVDEDIALLDKNDVMRLEAQAIFNRRLKQAVEWHNDIFRTFKNLSTIFGPALVYQILFSSIAICLMAYEVAEQLDQGKLDILFAILTVIACVQLWIPCYVGSIMEEKGYSVGDTCFHCGWENTRLSRLVRNDLIIIIFRSQKPLTIQFTGTPRIQLQTFSNLMGTAYQYFNMLRQMKDEH